LQDKSPIALSREAIRVLQVQAPDNSNAQGSDNNDGNDDDDDDNEELFNDDKNYMASNETDPNNDVVQGSNAAEGDNTTDDNLFGLPYTHNLHDGMDKPIFDDELHPSDDTDMEVPELP